MGTNSNCTEQGVSTGFCLAKTFVLRPVYRNHFACTRPLPKTAGWKLFCNEAASFLIIPKASAEIQHWQSPRSESKKLEALVFCWSMRVTWMPIHPKLDTLHNFSLTAKMFIIMDHKQAGSCHPSVVRNHPMFDVRFFISKINLHPWKTTEFKMRVLGQVNSFTIPEKISPFPDRHTNTICTAFILFGTFACFSTFFFSFSPALKNDCFFHSQCIVLLSCWLSKKNSNNVTHGPSFEERVLTLPHTQIQIHNKDWPVKIQVLDKHTLRFFRVKL